MKLSDILEMMKDVMAEDEQDENEDELPHLHCTLNIPGFTKLSPEEAAAIAKKLPKVDPDIPYDIEYDEAPIYGGKRLKRDPKLGAYTDLYRRISAADPETAATYKYRGVSVSDVSKTTEQENQRIVECLTKNLPAYVLKQNYDDDTFGFQVSSPEALYALLNNAAYDTFQDFGYRDPESTIEEEFINLLLGYTSRINIVFPELGGVVHLGNCGQLYIGAPDTERLTRLEQLLQTVGEFVEIKDDIYVNEDDEYLD